VSSSVTGKGTGRVTILGKSTYPKGERTFVELQGSGNGRENEVATIDTRRVIRDHFLRSVNLPNNARRRWKSAV